MIGPVILALSSLSLTHAAYSSDSKVASAWFAGWHATEGFPVSSVSWSKYTSMTYAFAETTEDVNVLSLNGSNPDVFPEFVAAAHANGVSARISIGGWTGSRFWSTAVGSAENRTAFVNTVTSFASLYNLDGLDFDWEYPNNQGLGCNTINANDTTNFLSFLRELKQHPLGSQLTLSAAVSINPFMDANGIPSMDVSEFADYLDYISIMNYDVWGSWSSSVGPNAPLNDTCAAPANQQGSAVYAIGKWTAAGFPREQILLGLPAYGHSFAVSAADAYVNGTEELKLYPAFNSSKHPVGGAWDDAPKVNKCGVQENQAGVITFWSLIAEGYLDSYGEALEGVPYVYDNCSQTPFIYNATTEVMISFDNARSFEAKGQFISDNGLAGFAIWEAGGDSSDILLDAVRFHLF